MAFPLKWLPSPCAGLSDETVEILLTARVPLGGAGGGGQAAREAREESAVEEAADGAAGESEEVAVEERSAVEGSEAVVSPLARNEAAQ